MTIPKQLRFVILALIVFVAFEIVPKYTPQPSTENTLAQAAKSPNPITDLPNVEGPPVQPASPIQSSLFIPVLMYHHVGYDADPNAMDLTVTPEDFEIQVQYFKNKGYSTITLSEAYNALVNAGTLPKKPLVFTFDDGYKDVFTYAVPILEKYGYLGSFAISTELLGRPSYAVWEDVLSANKTGMEIISHSENHLDLTSPKYSEDDLRREIFGSKKKLEEKLGTSIDFFVYPYGTHNEKVYAILNEAGYKMAFTTAYGQYLGQNNLLTEPRVRVHGQDGLEKLKKVFEPVAIKRNASAPTNP